MSLFTKLFEAVHSWRRRRGGTKSRKRSDLAMEQLDHRQLLAVNFTGNVPIDFPATQSPGVVVIPSPTTPPLNQRPGISATLAPFINVSGIEINSLAVSYDSTDDILSVGVRGPANNFNLTTPVAGKNGQDVIAADSDNNLNSGTVNPAINDGMGGGVEPTFQDPPDMGGTKQYAVLFDFNGDKIPDVVAGFPQMAPNGTNPSAKPFEVAKAIPNPMFPTTAPSFDNSNIFPQYTGTYFLLNDPNHPNFEFHINHFSQLYQQISGQTLTPLTSIGIGAFASNNQSIGISDEFFPPQNVTITNATVPPPTPPPPPPIVDCSPTIYVNPHEGNHVNTAHPSSIRVNILGSSGFDPTKIIPSTVRFGDPTTINTNGATPILNFESNVNHDEFPDETFVFNGLDVVLPAGITTAQITGETTSGGFFNSQVKVFNRDDSFYTQSALNKQQQTWLKYDKAHGIDTSNGPVAPPPVIPKAAQQRAASLAIDDLYGPFVGQKVPKQVNPNVGAAQVASSTSTPSVVAIPTKHGKAKKGAKITSSVTMSTPAATPPVTSLSGGA